MGLKQQAAPPVAAATTTMLQLHFRAVDIRAKVANSNNNMKVSLDFIIQNKNTLLKGAKLKQINVSSTDTDYLLFTYKQETQELQN